MTQQWLSLTDYASKYRVSISTLRRRIKSNLIPYRVEKGKYLVPDEGPVTEDKAFEPSVLVGEPAPLRHVSADEPFIASASRLLSELKKAYANILQEKEEQIIQLKEEVADLKTLVRVLEDDNERLKRALVDAASRR